VFQPSFESQTDIVNSILRSCRCSVCSSRVYCKLDYQTRSHQIKTFDLSFLSSLFSTQLHQHSLRIRKSLQSVLAIGFRTRHSLYSSIMLTLFINLYVKQARCSNFVTRLDARSLKRYRYEQLDNTIQPITVLTLCSNQYFVQISLVCDDCMKTVRYKSNPSITSEFQLTASLFILVAGQSRKVRAFRS
jgi:hypothetical protein